MRFTEIILIALALAVDAFAVGVAVGISHRKPRQIFRLSFHFGLFQALLPLVGAVAGSWMSNIISSFSQWVAFALLSLTGGKMMYNNYDDDDGFLRDPTRGLQLVMLSMAVSIDALAVGFTLGLEKVSILMAVSIIGLIASLMTLCGMLLAGKIASRISHRLEPFAGLVLIGLGIKTVVVHYL